MAENQVKDFISDEEMGQVDQPTSKPSQPDFISDADMGQQGKPQVSESKFSQKDPWYSVHPERFGQGVMAGLETLDEYTGAPIRKYLTEAVTGEQLDKAPTGKEQAEMMGATPMSYGEAFGVPKYLGGGISPADIYGFGLEMIQDPFMMSAAGRRGLKGAAKFADAAMTKGVQKQTAKATAEATGKATATIKGGAVEAEMGGEFFKYKAPESLEELRQWKPKGSDADLISKDRLSQIENTVIDLETKPLKYHYDMLENPKSMKELKLKFENLPTEDAQRIASYNQTMLNESVGKLDSTVGKISKTPNRSVPDAGYDFMESAKVKYLDEKKELGPLFEVIQKRSPNLGKQSSSDLIIHLGENSKIGKLLDQDEAGRFFLKKNAPRTGLSDQEHGMLSRLIDDLNDGMTFKEMQQTREFLRKAVDPMNPGATREINKVRTLMLDQMGDMASKTGQDVGAVFKRYAINEKTRESVEKIIGGRIDDLDKLYAANPDKIVKKIFSNPNNVDVVKQYLGQDKVNELLGSFVQDGMRKATSSVDGFSPYKFKTWMKSNSHILERHLEPEVFERMLGLNDYGVFSKKFLTEVNPSGTAASLQSMIEPQGFMAKISRGDIVGAVSSETVGRVSSKVKQRQSMKAVDEAMRGAPKQRMSKMRPSQMKKLSKAADVGATARVAESSSKLVKEKKGQEKFVSKGLKSIIDSTGDQSFQTLENSQDKEVKRLLMQASGLKKDSKMYNSIVKKLRRKVGK